jgi:hypothetical protein
MIKNASRGALSSLLALALLVGAGARPARAQSPADKSAAESLFDDARRKIDAHDYLAASKALESSQRLDPGIGTLLYLGDCYEKIGRTASAWATFREAASLARAAGQLDREAVALRRATALEAALPKLALNVAPGNDRPGFALRRDGEALSKAIWGASVPVDPGEHTLEATAPGKKRWSTKVTLTPGAAPVDVQVPALETDPLQGAADAKAKSATSPDSGGPPASSWGAQRTLGVVLGGAGLVGIGLGTYFGLKAGSLDKDAGAACRPEDPTKCTAAGAALGADARQAALGSTLSFALGGAALAGGVVVFLTAPRPHGATTALRVQAASGLVAGAPGLLLGGQW